MKCNSTLYYILSIYNFLSSLGHVVTKSDRWVSSGYPGFLPVRKTIQTLTSGPMSRISMSCITCFIIVVKSNQVYTIYYDPL